MLHVCASDQPHERNYFTRKIQRKPKKNVFCGPALLFELRQEVVAEMKVIVWRDAKLYVLTRNKRQKHPALKLFPRKIGLVLVQKGAKAGVITGRKGTFGENRPEHTKTPLLAPSQRLLKPQKPERAGNRGVFIPKGNGKQQKDAFWGKKGGLSGRKLRKTVFGTKNKEIRVLLHNSWWKPGRKNFSRKSQYAGLQQLHRRDSGPSLLGDLRVQRGTWQGRIRLCHELVVLSNTS